MQKLYTLLVDSAFLEYLLSCYKRISLLAYKLEIISILYIIYSSTLYTRASTIVFIVINSYLLLLATFLYISNTTLYSFKLSTIITTFT